MDAATEHPHPSRLKLVGLRALIALAALNIWTGAPLLGVWVGSKAASSSQPSMGIFALIAIVIFATCLALVRLIAWATAVHDDLTGERHAVRRQVPWLRSMRGERVEWERGRAGLTALERTLVAVVLLATVVFEVWFFFFSGSSIGSG
ncbi:MAG: hypothetical protein HZB46_16995 [Solirubrobacterales bacterium]|nr:hypothetical protein [Solirubrobacterales bacterium]